MTAPHTTRPNVTWDINHLKRGTTYLAATRTGFAVGEYVGIEAPHGDRAILLRHDDGTESIAFSDITVLLTAAA